MAADSMGLPLATFINALFSCRTTVVAPTVLDYLVVSPKHAVNVSWYLKNVVTKW